MIAKLWERLAESPYPVVWDLWVGAAAMSSAISIRSRVQLPNYRIPRHQTPFVSMDFGRTVSASEPVNPPVQMPRPYTPFPPTPKFAPKLGLLRGVICHPKLFTFF